MYNSLHIRYGISIYDAEVDNSGSWLRLSFGKQDSQQVFTYNLQYDTVQYSFIGVKYYLSLYTIRMHFEGRLLMIDR